ncbi:hypothetical protein IJ182_00685 [bacterium]|nr:hypothetical protein [bacterium]
MDIQPVQQQSIYYLQGGSMHSAGMNAIAAGMGTIDANTNALKIHPTDTVERPTKTTENYSLNNIKSIYKDSFFCSNNNFYLTYYGINFQTKNRDSE